MMPAKARIYPIFLPHAGCPFHCVYCNQRCVTGGTATVPAATGLIARFHEQFDVLTTHVRQTGVPGELAFYGGTFTALPQRILISILDRASLRVRDGTFSGIRFSTRPDCVSEATCSVLSDYPIATVELGAQSLCEEVLRASRRGYAAREVLQAAARVRRHGWSLGLQLMPGLPEDTRERFLDTVCRAIDLRPAFVRLYPTVVLKHTVLAEWYYAGIYQPLNLEQAISWCVAAYDCCIKAGIAVARMGLHADPELEKPGTILAGPFHPAFGYLVRVRRWRELVDAILGQDAARQGSVIHAQRREPGAISGKDARIGAVTGGCGTADGLMLRVCSRYLSEVVGPRRANIDYWRQKWNLRQVRVEGESSWAPGQIEYAWDWAQPEAVSKTS